MESVNLLQFYDRFSSEKLCEEFLIKARWPGGEIICPKCGVIGVKAYRLSTGRLKCAICRQAFTVRTGSVFEESKLPLRKWFLAIYLATSLKKGISSVQLAKYLGVTQKSAWFVLSRIRYVFDTGSFEKMQGQIEIDGSYLGGKETNKHFNKRTKGTQGRGSAKIKAPMFGLLERNGEVRTMVMPESDGKKVKETIQKHVSPNAVIYTDEYMHYRGLQKLGYQHVAVNHSANQWINGLASTNSLEGFWSHVKRGVNGIQHHVSMRHLQLYLDEYGYRWNTRDMTDIERFTKWFARTNGKRLTYKELIGQQ